jgi:V/A-type H+-transporting ATPase subunit A
MEVKEKINDQKIKATGRIVKAFGNLIHVEFEGNICQGEVAFIKLGDLSFSAEVIEIKGNEAKLQVFEDTRGIKLHTPVVFMERLLEAELGPGLITSIFDGLQNPLEAVAKVSGLFLSRGVYLPPLNREKKWDFTPTASVGDVLEKGSAYGQVKETMFDHKIMIPFNLRGKFTISWIAKPGSYTITDVVAKVTDENQKEHQLTMLQRWPVKMALQVGRKVKPKELMPTGLRIIDTQFPLLKGGTFCTPGPFGAGKTVLQHHLSKYSEVDIVIIAACGERAGEVVELLREFPKLIDERTKRSLIERTVIICNTSSMPVAAREASIYMAVTIAEYYRQMGLNVLVLADSTSRWAQAMREISGRLEEIPGEEAFPAYLASRIAAFYERSGVLEVKDGSQGSLTIGGSVSPAGGNFEEPVTQSTLTVVGAFLGLSRSRSDARRYPAIDPLISWTKYSEQVGAVINEKIPDWTNKVKKAYFIIKKGEEISKRMEVVGEEGTAIEDIITYLKAELYDNCYLQQNSFDKVDAFCSLERQLELFNLIQKIFDIEFSFDGNDEAREYFLTIQNELKNMNFIPFNSEEYKQIHKSILEKIEK